MFFSYVKRRWKVLSALALFTLIFALVFSLYELPTEAVLYASGLCFVLGAGLLGYSYYLYRRRCRTLETLQRSICVSSDGLPAPEDRIEELYQELIYVLSDERSRIEAVYEGEKRDANDYYAMWAHQIKTPISAMQLLLQQSEVPDRNALSAELLRVEQYVEMVLSYQKLEGGGSDFVLRKRSLDGIVRTCLRKYARLFIMKKLPLDFRETHMTVYTDEKWLAFMIEQILSNSLKYTSTGGISIYAEGKALVIEDTGIGIAAEDLPRLGERGYTGYNGHEDKKSTGLGLYLCRTICEKLGHRLEIESTPGQGTRVKLLFSDSTMLYD
ncbi:MAG TPA: sensor histidine kinase [Candidatus Scatomorpha merdigallinarum]|nr:sensor histidine kinase [Candidatus Scatomorpha merdigallinarum]